MSYVSVKVDIDVNAIDRQIRQGISNGIEKVMPKLEAYAKTNHRYVNQTGNLTNSISTRKLEMGLSLFADANYASYVHDGQRSWTPDPWIADTIKNNEDLIIKTIEEEIAKELKR